MELHSSPTASKKLWKILRVAFFMMRKGFMSKRKLIMDMNLMMQKGKVLGKSLGKNLAFHPHTSGSSVPGFGLHEYEFSCTTSSNPIFFRVNSKRKHSYFPCMGASAVEELPDKSPGAVIVLPRIEYSPKGSAGPAALAASAGELMTPGEGCTPIPSPFSVRVSNYSLAEEGDGVGGEVDNRAEEFIRRFYQQLHAQGQIGLLQYQEEQYQEMLSRGI
ncbi:uncharacterized protein M6B38_279570 [Iris pallida]|uniref:Uncharacterized protein n=1 Tax=Iris pallida TaxID=29817 RepID=A0AAX6HZW7_IRIPA|nr:uncharacterized protein M6B38_279570 [Iris pallida]